MGRLRRLFPVGSPDREIDLPIPPPPAKVKKVYLVTSNGEIGAFDDIFLASAALDGLQASLGPDGAMLEHLPLNRLTPRGRD